MPSSDMVNILYYHSNTFHGLAKFYAVFYKIKLVFSSKIFLSNLSKTRVPILIVEYSTLATVYDIDSLSPKAILLCSSIWDIT